MTYAEKIRALKENKCAFGLMDEELQELAHKIGPDEFEYFDQGYSHEPLKWTKNGCNFYTSKWTFRLRPDYPEAEPGPIEDRQIEAKIRELVDFIAAVYRKQ